MIEPSITVSHTDENAVQVKVNNASQGFSKWSFKNKLMNNHSKTLYMRIAILKFHLTHFLGLLIHCQSVCELCILFSSLQNISMWVIDKYCKDAIHYI